MSRSYFFCPASGYLNQFNEKGSFGPISYQFLSALTKKEQYSKITAIVFNSFQVNPIGKVRIVPLLQDSNLTEISSLKFYLKSFFTFFRSEEYRKSDVVQHFLPFTPTGSFNLFFLFKNPHKTYVLGPLIGTHVNTSLFGEESLPNKRILITIVRNLIVKIVPRIFAVLSSWTIKKADIVLFSDHYSLGCYKRYLNKNQTIKVLGLGVDQDVFTKASRPSHVPLNSLRVLFVGRLTERKGCRYLIQAISEVQRLRPDLKIDCQIVGYGMQETELKQMVQDSNLSTRVSFSGQLKRNSEIVKYYRACDVVCIPALSDTWVSAKEALCCGKPVIVTDIASHPEIVQDGVNGFLIPIQNSSIIAEKLILLATHSSLTQKLSENAYRLAQQRYNWDKIIDNYLLVIDKYAKK